MWLLIALGALVLVAKSASPAAALSSYLKGKYLVQSETKGTFYLINDKPFPEAKPAAYFTAMAATQWKTGVWMNHDKTQMRFGPPSESQQMAHDGFELVVAPLVKLTPR